MRFSSLKFRNSGRKRCKFERKKVQRSENLEDNTLNVEMRKSCKFLRKKKGKGKISRCIYTFKKSSICGVTVEACIQQLKKMKMKMKNLLFWDLFFLHKKSQFWVKIVKKLIYKIQDFQFSKSNSWDKSQHLKIKSWNFRLIWAKIITKTNSAKQVCNFFYFYFFFNLRKQASIDFGDNGISNFLGKISLNFWKKAKNTK